METIHLKEGNKMETEKLLAFVSLVVSGIAAIVAILVKYR